MMRNVKKWLNQSFAPILWDLWCCVSLIGIWPRFIEPQMLLTTFRTLRLPSLPQELKGLKILQISDLHLNKSVPPSFIQKLHEKCRILKPDLIVFTGDFICGSRLVDPARLEQVLKGFSAPYGCYAILGNHDYAEYVSPNAVGDYDVVEDDRSILSKGWGRLFFPIKLSGRVTQKAQDVGLHEELLKVIEKTPFHLIHNSVKKVQIKGVSLNICGIGEYTLGRALPEIAFKEHDPKAFTVVLVHNPDALPLLKRFAGDLILCGHTHGGQINLPYLRDKFSLLENKHLKRGSHQVDGKWVYINRGLGAGMRFRWFSPPEILLLTLEDSDG